MPYRSAIGKQQHSNLNFLERALKAHTPPLHFLHVSRCYIFWLHTAIVYVRAACCP